MERTIEFTKDFGGKKKGDKWTTGSGLASTLVRQDKVAKYVDGVKPKTPKSAMSPSDVLKGETKRKKSKANAGKKK